MSGKTVQCLYIGGDDKDVVYFREILSEVPHTSFVIDTIANASFLEDYLSRSVDVILIDVDVSKSYGCDALTAIKKMAGDIPVLGISNTEVPELSVKAARCGAQDYVAKTEITGRALSRSILYAIERNNLILELKHASELPFYRMIDKNADGILILDMEGWIRFANPAAERLFGKDSGRLIGQYLGLPVITSDKTEIDILNSNRVLTAVEMQVVEIEWERQPHFLASLRDITERKRLLNDITDLNKNLEQRVLEEVQKCQLQQDILIQKSKMAALGEMIGSIAHQWRQPLNSLGLIIQDLKEAYEFNQVDQRYIDSAVDSGLDLIKFMSDTITDFSDFFKPTKRKIRIDVNTIINSVLSILSTEMKHLKINFKHACRCHSHEIELQDCKRLIGCEFGYLYIIGYPNEIKQVLLNIIANAKDAILAAKSKRLLKDGERGLIEIYTIKNTDDITVTIKDNAGGIPEAILDKLFTPYLTTKGIGGTGIGLYMSKTIIESNMGGRLYAENTANGAAFTIVLPKLKLDAV